MVIVPGIRSMAKDIKGKRIPFGALVHFIPSRTIGRSAPMKHDPNAVPGIFMGYAISSGYTWNNQYRVAMIEDFANRNFHRSCSAEDHRFSLHIGRGMDAFTTRVSFTGQV